MTSPSRTELESTGDPADALTVPSTTGLPLAAHRAHRSRKETALMFRLTVGYVRYALSALATVAFGVGAN
jgi:hypothetical protein